MRLVDVEEISALTEFSVLEAVESSITDTAYPYCHAVLADDVLVCIYGCSRAGNPWLLCTHEMNKHLVGLTRRTRIIVRMMLRKWPIIWNIVDCRNTETIRWLKIIGFVFHESYEIKPGIPVIRFEMTRDEPDRKNITGRERV